MSHEVRFTRLLQPSAKLKADQAAKVFQQRAFQTAGPIDVPRFAAEAVRAKFGRISQTEVDVLTAVVLSETLRLTEEDLKELEEASRRLKQAVMHLEGKIRTTEGRAMRARPGAAPPRVAPRGKKPAAVTGPNVKEARTRNLGITYPDSGLVGSTQVQYDLGDAVTVQGLKDVLDEMKGKLDGMNEMSEMTSLRLQMTMDRRSKFISTLSNIMKKISTTQDTLTQNIK